MLSTMVNIFHALITLNRYLYKINLNKNVVILTKLRITLDNKLNLFSYQIICQIFIFNCGTKYLIFLIFHISYYQ